MSSRIAWDAWSWLLVVLLLPLLGVLAVLQYRWTGELSRGERDRTESGLRRAMTGLASDFDEEITRLFSHFQSALLTASATGESPEELVVERVETWREEARYPDLIRAWFLVGPERGGENGSSGLIGSDGAAMAWPSELSAVRDELEAHDGSGRLPKPIVADGPALILPISPLSWLEAARHRSRADGRSGQEGRPRQRPDRRGRRQSWRDLRGGPSASGGSASADQPSRFLILWLDLETLERGILPDLVAHHFTPEGRGSLDFQLTVLDAEGRDVLFRQGPELSNPAAEIEGEVPFFRIRPPALGPPGGEPRGNEPRSREDESSPEFPRRGEGFESPGPPGGRGEPGLSAPGPGRWLRAFARGWLHEAGKSQWVLIARHPEGSLDRAVARARQRNLALSLGVLALLGASLGFLLYATRRAQLLARQQLEFVAGVTHELMTPLAALRSAGQNLADGVVTEPEQVRKYGGLIDREGRRLSNMVGQVLELAGMWSTRRTLRTEPVPVDRIVAGALAAREHELGDFEVETHIPEPAPRVLADREALTRALSNLIGNAVKYAAEGAWLQISAVRDGSTVELRVADRGPGIEPADLPQIFQPFRRGRGKAASAVPGSGLGLSLVRSIAEAHGGDIEVESTGAAGTTFLLRLPAAHGDSA